MEQLEASGSRRDVELGLVVQERDALKQLLQLNMDEAAQQGLDTAAGAAWSCRGDHTSCTVREALEALQAIRTGLESQLQAAEARIAAVEAAAASHQATAHEWQARANDLQRRLDAAESEAAALGAQVATLQQRLGRGEYDPAITRVRRKDVLSTHVRDIHAVDACICAASLGPLCTL